MGKTNCPVQYNEKESSDELFVRREIMDKDASEITIEGTRFLSEKVVKKAIVRCEKRSVNPVTAFDCGFQAGVKAVKEEFELVFERE